MLHHSTVPGYFDRLKFVVAASLWMIYIDLWHVYAMWSRIPEDVARTSPHVESW